MSPLGAHPEVGHGATMSDDDEDYDSDYGSYDQHSMDYNDSGAYGPLVPTETERTLMERVRQELKHELKQVILYPLTEVFIHSFITIRRILPVSMVCSSARSSKVSQWCT